MQKKIRIVFFIALLLSTKFVCAQDNIIDEVIWVVGDDAILKSEVEKQIQQMKYEKIDIAGDPYCSVPEQMAIRKLFLNQAKLDSLSANEGTISAQVDQRVSEIIAQIGSQEKLEEYYGKTLKEIKEELRGQAREQALVQQVQQKLIGDQKITPSEVRKAFSKVSAQDIPIIPAKAEIEIVAIDPPIATQEVESIKAKLRGFKERIETGDATFSMLATLYSDDLTSAKMGGELGFMGKGQLVPEFAEEAFNLTDTKKVSRIIQTEFGFHIIQLIERRGDKVNCRHILIKPKPQLAEKTKAIERLDSLTTLIRTGKLSFELAALGFSTDKNTRMNGGLMSNSQDGTSKFEYQNLPPEISKLAYSLKVGEISAPFSMINQSGREVCAIIKVKSKIDQHKANLDDDYQQLKTFILNKKNADTIDTWIKAKQKEIYVKINPNWQNCEFQYPNWVKK